MTDATHWLNPQLFASWPFALLLGLCIGSFLNVVIYRLPVLMERDAWVEAALHLDDQAAWRRVFGANEAMPPALPAAYQSLESRIEALPSFGLSRPASRCPACGHQIRWYENLPVLSWLVLRGRCSACRTPISPRYPLVELFTGAVFAALAWRLGPTWSSLMWCAVAAVLIALAGIDWDTTYLPDSLTLPLMWAGILAAVLGWNTSLSPTQAIWGAVAGYLSLWLVYWAFKLATGKEGMGYGDFKLLAALGAWLGAPMIIPILLMASVVGAVVGLGMKAARTLREGRYVPFGPFLAGGGLLIMLVGPGPFLRLIGWR